MKKISIALALVSALTLSGCAAGFDAATSAQGNSGNGRTADVGSIQIRNAVIVVDAQTQLNASLVATIINTADEADATRSVNSA
jgi:outer membrane lipoprotein SlyB